MTSFLECLKKVLEEFHLKEPERQELLVKAYNNDDALRRHKNSRPRTELMVKGLVLDQNGQPASGFLQKGLIARAATIAASAESNEPPTFSRYTDIAISSGNWWKGERFKVLAVEVENAWSEIAGTIKDLLLIQARKKWAVFYGDVSDSNYPRAEKALKDAISSAWKSFKSNEFQENPNTCYEIVVLPGKIPDTGLRGASVLEMKFCSKDAAEGEPKLKLERNTL